MRNPITKEYKITLGGRERALHFEHADFAEAEEKLNRPLLGPGAKEFWESAERTPSATTGILLFVGLQQECPELTLRQVRRLITFDNATEVERVVTRAVRECLMGDEEPEESEASEESPLASETGGTSDGPSDSKPSASVTPISGD